MTAATKIQWRVQVRKSRAHKWVNKGLFETRDAARVRGRLMQSGTFTNSGHWSPGGGVGFGNTRVQHHYKA